MQVLVYVSRFVNNKVWIQSQQVEIGPSVAGTVSTCRLYLFAALVHVAISRSLDALHAKAVTQYILVSINMKQIQR